MRPVQRAAAKQEGEQADSMRQQKEKKQQQQQQQPLKDPQMQRQTSSPSGGATPFNPARRVGARGGPQLFAQKLFTLVEEEDPEIVEWLPDGLAFRVKDIHRFSSEVLEKYFNHSKFTSFQRQLNLYQFKRRKGAHAGAFHHPCFRKGHRHLLSKVRRQKVKRDLAVEARAAQKLARTREGRNGHRSSDQTARGRTRAATQADICPVRMEPEDEDASYDEYTLGSRCSALRRRVISGAAPSVSDVDGMENFNAGDESSSNEDTWPSNSAGEMERFSSTKEQEQEEDWQQQVPGSPHRSPEEVHHVSTPMTPQSSDYEYSPRISLIRTSSARSSLISSSSSLGSSPGGEVFHSSRYPFDGASSDCSQSPATPSNAPVGETMQAAQVSPPDHNLSLAAMIDASTGGWGSPNHSTSLRHFEPLGWSSAFCDDATSSTDPVAAMGEAASIQPQPPTTQAPHHEDFGFIDLFSINMEDGGGSPLSSAAASLDFATAAEGKMDGFMKEVEAAGVFGLEDFLGAPRGPYAGAAVDYA